MKFSVIPAASDFPATFSLSVIWTRRTRCRLSIQTSIGNSGIWAFFCNSVLRSGLAIGRGDGVWQLREVDLSLIVGGLHAVDGLLTEILDRAVSRRAQEIQVLTGIVEGGAAVEQGPIACRSV